MMYWVETLTDVTQKSFLAHPHPPLAFAHAHTQRGAAGQVLSVRCSRDDERGFSRRSNGLLRRMPLGKGCVFCLVEHFLHEFSRMRNIKP